MLAAFANTFRIPDLRKRILFTVGLVFICRLVSMVPTPGVNWHALEEVANRMREQGGLMGWFDVFSGGAMSHCSVGFLSIWPYISATIVIQLMTAVVPTLERLSREGDTGRAKINQYARYLTLVICVFQSYLLAAGLDSANTLKQFGITVPLVDPSFCGLPFRLLTVLTMTTSTMFVVWLGDQITVRGIGNGSSVVIMVNICSRLPAAIFVAWQRYFSTGGESVFELLLLLLLGFAVIMGTVMLTQGLRKIPIHSTKRAVGTKQYGGQSTYMPLRVNYSGVMPIIFAQPLIQFSGAALSRIAPEAFKWPFMRECMSGLQSFGASLSNMGSPLHIGCYAVLIFFFSFFWVATQFNAVRIADDLKRNGSYIPGIRPGMATAEHLDMVMTRVTFFGALGLLTVAIVPQVLDGLFKIPWAMSSFFGGSSLLIIVGVALDTLRQMESHLLMRNYDGFLKHGRLQGRK
jgi:preprotein translocase subunit SecY